MRVPGSLQSRRAQLSEGRSLDLRSGRTIFSAGPGRLADAIGLRPGVRTSLLIAILALAALLPAIRVADAQVTVVLVSNLNQVDDRLYQLGAFEIAQRFTTGAEVDGYTLTGIELWVQAVPSTMTVKLLTGVPDDIIEVATLNNPVPLASGLMKFTAPANTTLSANTTYYVNVRASNGSSVRGTSAFEEDSSDSVGWSMGDGLYQKQVSNTTWQSRNDILIRLAINGFVGRATPAIPPSPDPANFARGPIQWQSDGQSEAQASTQSFPTRLNEISANKPTNASGSLDLSPIAASISEARRPQSRGFYLTVTVDPPGDGYTVEDAESRRYTLPAGASLIKVRLWHVYHHVGRGLNSVELLGGSTANNRDNRLTEPVEVCLPAPAANAERARIAVRGQHDRHWTILETTLTDDGRICAPTVRVAWLTVVLEPPEESAAA